MYGEADAFIWHESSSVPYGRACGCCRDILFTFASSRENHASDQRNL